MDPARFPDGLEPEFRCVRCGLVLVQPVRAPCHHEFCRHCLPHLRIDPEDSAAPGEVTVTSPDVSAVRPVSPAKMDSTAVSAAAAWAATAAAAATTMSETNVTVATVAEADGDEPLMAATESEVTPGDGRAAGAESDDARYRCCVAGCRRPRFAGRAAMVAPKTGALLAKLLITCDNREGGCRWVGQWGALLAHRELECDFETVPCPFARAGCPDRLERRHVGPHKAHCAYRTSQCPHCLALLKHKDLALHVTRCGLAPADCPKCGAAMTRGALEKHAADDCPMAEVPCPLHVLGCPVRMARQDVERHASAAAAQHLALLLSRMEAERDAHATAVAALRGQVAERDRQLAAQTSADGRPFAAIAAELRGTVRDQQLAIDRLLRGGVVFVDAGGCGHYRTPSEALRRCAAGDTVVLRPGVYCDAAVVVAPGVTVRGVSAGEVTLRSDEVTPVALRAPGAVLCDITVVAASPVSAAVRVEAPGCRVERVDASAANLSAIVVATAGAGATIRDCTAGRTKQHAVEWRAAGDGGLIERCLLAECQRPALAVAKGARVEVRSCQLRRSALNGLWLAEAAEAVVTGGVIGPNAFSNVDVGSGAHCTLIDVDIRHSDKCGVCVAGRGRLVMRRCRVHSNALPNVAVLSGGRAQLEGNEISGGHTQGLVVKRGGRCLSIDDAVRGNCDANVAVENGGHYGTRPEQAAAVLDEDGGEASVMDESASLGLMRSSGPAVTDADVAAAYAAELPASVSAEGPPAAKGAAGRAAAAAAAAAADGMLSPGPALDAGGPEVSAL